MDKPDFGPDERLIIAYYTSEPWTRGWLVWALHGAITALFIYGLVRMDQATLFAAFGMVILFRFYESSFQPRYYRATRNVIMKYERFVAEQCGSASNARSKA